MPAGTTSVTEDIYQEHILDHFESPYHKGHLAHPTCCHRDKNPLCGDVIELQLKIDANDCVSEAYFDGKGCAISQAAASILCEQIEGKPVSELKDMQAQQMLDLLHVPLTASRQKCGLLAFKVLKTLVYAHETDEPQA
ncbi:MAG: nitrogen-fixing NifU domain protein [Planctomycetaceae bacterium]|nr:nitrogen-fixing NifU domain protein [Planctomycetaceae bacterium]